MQKEVHVEPGAQALVRLAPFRHHHRVGIVFVQVSAHVLPQADGLLVAGVVLDQRTGHVDAEAVAAAVQPEGHHVLHGLAGGQRFGRIDRALPGLGHGGKAVVQRGLHREKVDRHAAVALRDAAQRPGDALVAGDVVPHGVCPDVAPAVGVLFGLAALLEPAVLDRRVPRHQVQQHMHALGVRGPEQLNEVVVGAVARRNQAIVGHVIARVAKRRKEARVQPQRIAAQLPDIVQLGRDARDIPDAVPVRVIETLRINLIENCVFQPLAHTDRVLSGPAAVVLM